MIPALPAEWRVFVAVGLLLVVASWTWDRIVGQDDDPTLSASSFSGTGGFSILFTGVHVVALVVGVATLLMWDRVVANPALLFVPVGLVALHYYYEDAERDGGLFGPFSVFGGEDDD